MADTRTEHPPRHTNRLAKETSPYLLQHAHNPVDWYPWGDEAFRAARDQDKPIFLSVGYSTCYWCHVMERQCFENEPIAAEMNRRFINIKVDREERPDVDQLYMTAVQVLTQHGGWPMSVFLTPELKPFYGGTYFPPTDAHGRPGFPTLLRGIEDAYRNRKADVDKSAEQLVNILQQVAEPATPTSAITIDDAFIDNLVGRSVSDYDSRNGGFGGAPKFPRETLLEMLLAYTGGDGSEISDFRSQILKRVRHTLDALALGGIRDHLGGGFHRYSTDAHWLVPHFEIMLYDNAMLAYVYLEAYRQTEEQRYAHVARGILDFVLRDMTSPEGGFYTALDAEVDHQEGLNYLWTKDEVESVLRDAGIGAAPIVWFTHVFGLDAGPNFADPHQGNGKPDKNILYVYDRNAYDYEGSRDMREALLAARRKRKQPLLDTKIITSWNALMLRALAYAGQILQEQKYLDAAGRNADFLLRQHRTPDGGLYRTSRDGVMKFDAFLDDYAFLIQALIALRDASGKEQWKDHAAALAIQMVDKFEDVARGGFHFTDKDAKDLIVRQKIGSDSPLPSGNAVAAMAMLALNQSEVAQKAIAVFAQQMIGTGEGMSAMVQAAMTYLRREGEITVSAGQDASKADRPLSPEQLAGKVVSMNAAWSDPSRLNVHVKVLKGFHINAHDASEGLIATQVSVPDADIAGIDYPNGKEHRFAFADKPIRVYDGEVEIVVRFKKPQTGTSRLKVSLSYQACDESACLPPVMKQIEVTTP